MADAAEPVTALGPTPEAADAREAAADAARRRARRCGVGAAAASAVGRGGECLKRAAHVREVDHHVAGAQGRRLARRARLDGLGAARVHLEPHERRVARLGAAHAALRPERPAAVAIRRSSDGRLRRYSTK